MICLLKPLLEELKISLKNVEVEGKGVCQFCGRETELGSKKVFWKWLKKVSNPGISKMPLGIPDVCVDCTSILLSGIKPSSLRNGTDGATVFVSGYDEKDNPKCTWLVNESVESFYDKLTEVGKGKFVVLFLYSSGNYLPIIDLPNLRASYDPSSSWFLNVVEGSMMWSVPVVVDEVVNNPVGFQKLLRKRIFQGGEK